ncbi:conserved hypothetical protein [Candidatus Nitrotoga sp. BS]|uniref:glycosyltransferase n=1 Tax=Candidatus Nitrotoga sp. BS TaxID=2890408 RepID=UPI001EF355FC|nr:glycosyltransferase [Candidatus Nitrotoga sp. BS]CAH1202358.1 conserved hypothetical protein [Candidatus Nitrotoga sp. BS]
MNVLIVADTYPAPDRNSADFRFTKLLGMIAEEHEVFFCALGEKRQIEKMGGEQTARYRSAMIEAGVQVLDDGIGRALQSHNYGAVLFEWYFAAMALIDEVRIAQPNARVIIDSVDVVFNRLEAKARVTGAVEDSARAAQTKHDELSLYDKSDIVITVTDADAVILQHENSRLSICTIPNIHPLQQPVSIDATSDKCLLFIGSYVRPGGETNIDAMLYFCAEILPLIVAAEPSVKLRIIGGPQTPEIAELVSDHVDVMGFVPETKPFLETSAISIAPLRFGGGMKGKIGEAMSYGLPVVTTTTGIEGFGLTPGTHALVGDTPREFADAVIKLLQDRTLLDRIRMAGYQFIRENYSDVALKKRVNDLFDRLDDHPVKHLSLAIRMQSKLKQAWSRHIAWRLGSN